MARTNVGKFSGSKEFVKDEYASGPYQMNQEILTERAEKVNAGRYITQLYAAVLASLSSISFGTVLGWSSPAIRLAVDKHDSEVLKQSHHISWAAGLGPLGCALGVPVWSYSNIKFGPKTTMVLQSPFLFAAWLAIAVLERHPKWELLMRFFCGFLAISYRICGETLLSDTVHKHYLRRMVIAYRSCISVGILTSYIMGYQVSDQYFCIFNCFVVLVHFLMLLVCPESPIYLYEKSLKKAEESLSWYRGSSNIYVDMRNIKKDSDIRKVDPAAYKYMLYSKVVRKAVAIIIMVNAAQVISGYYIFLYYNPAVVKVIGNERVMKLKDVIIDEVDDSISRNADAMILGTNMLLSSIISTWVHYRVVFGIRKPLILSSTLVTIVLSFLAVYLYLYETKVEFLIHKNWIYQILVNSLIISYELGLSCCSEMMLVDYTPNQVFPRAKLIIKSAQWVMIYVVTINVFYMTKFLKGSGTYCIFAVASLILCICISLFVVESKGKTLVQVQTAIGGNPVGSRGVYNKSLG